MDSFTTGQQRRICFQVMTSSWRPGFTHQRADVKVQSSVVIRLGVVQMNEEEYVSPHVMFVTDVMAKTLQKKVTNHYTSKAMIILQFLSTHPQPTGRFFLHYDDDSDDKVGIMTSLGVQWPWWRHQMETFSALLAICAGNSPVPGEFPTQRPVTRSFDVFFDVRPNKRLSKQSWGWWVETPRRPLWRHRNANLLNDGILLQRFIWSYLSMMFKLVTLAAADETGITHVGLCSPLQNRTIFFQLMSVEHQAN